jgi:membrane protein
MMEPRSDSLAARPEPSGRRSTTFIERITYFFKEGVWEVQLKELPSPKAFFIKALRILIMASKRFVKDNCQKTASVLTYYSLLNIVPVVAVTFAIAKGFGVEKMIERQIMAIAEKANLEVELTNQILGFAHNLLNQAKGGLIAGVGIVLLLWTIISILGKIEESLNDIWEIKKARTLVAKFGDYMAVMVLGPVFFIISGSATVLVASQVTVFVSKMALLGVFSHVIMFLLDLLPYVSIWVFLTMLYLIMPNASIPVRSAVLGGVAAGTIAQIVQWVYIKFQIGVASYGAIYGSFAALPLFLAWLQTSWMILLFGAEIAYVSEHYETYGFQPDYSRVSASSMKFLILRVFHFLTKRFSQGEKPSSAKQIASSLEIPLRLVQTILQELMEVGLVVETVREAKGDSAFQPARTIDDITVKFVLDGYEERGTTKLPDRLPDADAEKISAYLKDIAETIEKSPGNVRLKEI